MKSLCQIVRNTIIERRENRRLHKLALELRNSEFQNESVEYVTELLKSIAKEKQGV